MNEGPISDSEVHPAASRKLKNFENAALLFLSVDEALPFSLHHCMYDPSASINCGGVHGTDLRQW